MGNLPQLDPLRRDSIHTRLFSQLFVHPVQFRDLSGARDQHNNGERGTLPLLAKTVEV